MTADRPRIPYALPDRISTRLIGEAPHTDRIICHITAKPPATVEWK